MSGESALVSRESVRKAFRNASVGYPMDFIKYEKSIDFINHEKVIKLKTFYFVCAFLCITRRHEPLP
jgi:hypothetical protein